MIRCIVPGVKDFKKIKGTNDTGQKSGGSHVGEKVYFRKKNSFLSADMGFGRESRAIVIVICGGGSPSLFCFIVLWKEAFRTLSNIVVGYFNKASFCYILFFMRCMPCKFLVRMRVLL